MLQQAFNTIHCRDSGRKVERERRKDGGRKLEKEGSKTNKDTELG